MKTNYFKKIDKGLFWDVHFRKLDLRRDRHFIIHRILAYGTMDDLRALLKIYGKKIVRKEFLKPQSGLYYPNILELCLHLFEIKKVNEKKYLKNIYEVL